MIMPVVGAGTVALRSRALLLCALALGACGKSHTKSAIRPTATLIDNRTDVLPTTALASIRGVYGEGCADRTGAWSLALGGSTSSADHAVLALLDDEEDCELTITQLTIADGRVLDAQAPIALTESYLDAPVGFGDPPLFYANARLARTGVNEGFELAFVFSENPLLATATPEEIPSYSATPAGMYVPAPDYRVDIASLAVQTDVSNVVQAVSGDAVLTTNSVVGLGYAIGLGALTSYDALDAAYLRGSQPMQTTISADRWSLLGADLTTPQVRTLIIANIVNGVRSYQAFAMTFRPLPR